MKKFNRIFILIAVIIAAVFAAANIAVIFNMNSSAREWRVEISRLAAQMEETGDMDPDIRGYVYVKAVSKFDPANVETNRDYMVKDVGGELYRFEYEAGSSNTSWLFLVVNISIAVIALVVILVLLYVRKNIVRPFSRFSGVPEALSRGELTSPIEADKSRFFGRFVWGVNMLRENIEDRNRREMELQKEKKVLLLSLSHDMKTPLAAIKLYSQALSKNLYKDEAKKKEIAESINLQADEMEGYLAQIITASREDFLQLDVEMSEFYLADLVETITAFYGEKLKMVGTDFMVEEYQNCLVKGDINRSVEVLQNIIENAIKYGDGRVIRISFGEDDGCVFVKVADSGETFSNDDTIHMFESFWRGSNAQNKKGSGLGLYICRQLMQKMTGDIFAEYRDGFMIITAVFTKSV